MNAFDLDPTRRSYSVRRLAESVDLSEQTIRREIEDGRLRAVRIRGRLTIPAESVDEWLRPA